MGQVLLWQGHTVAMSQFTRLIGNISPIKVSYSLASPFCSHAATQSKASLWLAGTDHVTGGPVIDQSEQSFSLGRDLDPPEKKQLDLFSIKLIK